MSVTLVGRRGLDLGERILGPELRAAGRAAGLEHWVGEFLLFRDESHPGHGKHGFLCKEMGKRIPSVKVFTKKDKERVLTRIIKTENSENSGNFYRLSGLIRRVAGGWSIGASVPALQSSSCAPWARAAARPWARRSRSSRRICWGSAWSRCGRISGACTGLGLCACSSAAFLFQATSSHWGCPGPWRSCPTGRPRLWPRGSMGSRWTSRRRCSRRPTCRAWSRSWWSPGVRRVACTTRSRPRGSRCVTGRIWHVQDLKRKGEHFSCLKNVNGDLKSWH